MQGGADAPYLTGVTQVSTRPCPICGKPEAALHRPFCSARCRDVDLNRWLKGVYSVPTDEVPGDGETPPE